MKGFFKTSTTGSSDHNCFAFPIRKGAWAIRRYTPGVAEHESWEQDGAGWTRCFLNREPDLSAASRAFGGLEDPSGGFVFREASVAREAAGLLGVDVKIGPSLASRKTKLKQHKDGRLVVSVNHEPQDMTDDMPGWLVKNNSFVKLFNANISTKNDEEVENYDDIVRHLIAGSEDAGWVLKSDNTWKGEPLQHLKIAISSMGYNTKDVTNILGSSIFRCWRIVNRPFQPEYPGNREWNRDAAQFRFLPSDSDQLSFETWTRILNHCGSGLDQTIIRDPWCQVNGIKTGGEYLKCWIASVLQDPLEPLPYLFFWNNVQNTGKSIFHEALSLLLTKGYQHANTSLTNPQEFNGELSGAIICVVEELDLRRSKVAYNRIKNWVTAKELSIHFKNRTPFHVPNSTHWIQCGNDPKYCPIFPGDTRITMCYVKHLSPLELIPKKILLEKLEKEAPDFLAEILKLEIPPSGDRLNIPVIETADKHTMEEFNTSELELFIAEFCRMSPGSKIRYSAFYDRFQAWIDPEDGHSWTKIKTGRELPPQFPKGRLRKDNHMYIGNIFWKGESDPDEIKGRYIKHGDHLETA